MYIHKCRNLFSPSAGALSRSSDAALDSALAYSMPSFVIPVQGTVGGGD